MNTNIIIQLTKLFCITFFVLTFLNNIKKTVKNKRSVEGSICEAYLIQEISHFSPHYFVSPMCLDVGVHQDRIQPTLSIFKPFGQAMGKCKERWFNHREWSVAQLHVLLNCNKVKPFIE